MSMMQTTVRLAVATAIAAAAAQSASANDISTYVASGSNATINVYLSGSTAVDNTLTCPCTRVCASVRFEATATRSACFCVSCPGSGVPRLHR